MSAVPPGRVTRWSSRHRLVPVGHGVDDVRAQHEIEGCVLEREIHHVHHAIHERMGGIEVDGVPGWASRAIARDHDRLGTDVEHVARDELGVPVEVEA